MHQLFEKNNNLLFENNVDQQGEWIVFSKNGLETTSYGSLWTYDFSSEIFLRTVIALIEQGWELRHVQLDDRYLTYLDETYLMQKLITLAHYHLCNVQLYEIYDLLTLYNGAIISASFKKPNIKIHTNGYVQFDDRNDLKPLIPIVKRLNDQIKEPYDGSSSNTSEEIYWAMLTLLLMRTYHWKLKDIKFDFLNDKLNQCYLMQKLMELSASKKLQQGVVLSLGRIFFYNVTSVTLTTPQQHNVVVQQYGEKVSGGNTKEVKLVSKLTKELEQNDGCIPKKYL